MRIEISYILLYIVTLAPQTISFNPGTNFDPGSVLRTNSTEKPRVASSDKTGKELEPVPPSKHHIKVKSSSRPDKKPPPPRDTINVRFTLSDSEQGNDPPQDRRIRKELELMFKEYRRRLNVGTRHFHLVYHNQLPAFMKLEDNDHGVIYWGEGVGRPGYYLDCISPPENRPRPVTECELLYHFLEEGSVSDSDSEAPSLASFRISNAWGYPLHEEDIDHQIRYSVLSMSEDDLLHASDSDSE
ncbi:hypothetical protein EV361DRAFT_932105 [Lentinula raphanica]|nr:hypothetical protein EV361DRAFT_932105 [Lentinula raphanica]